MFGRVPGYDPKKDPIVRTEASRFRSRLGEYYLGEGKADTLVIEVTKKNYVPVFQSVAEDHKRSSSRRFWNKQTIAAAITAVLVIAAALGWWRFHSTSRLPSPYCPSILNQDPANDHFADSLTDELIRNLSLIGGLAPRSRTSSFAFKGEPRNVHEVAKKLGVDYTVEGSVLRDGQRLRIDAQLIRTHDDFPIWSGKFDGEVTDVFAIQHEIARRIVNSLRLKLGRGRRRYETSIEAYDAFLRAQTLVTGEGLPAYLRSVGCYEEAIAKDPAFAPAYAGEATVYAALSGTFPQLTEQRNRLEKMRAAAPKPFNWTLSRCLRRGRERVRARRKMAGVGT